MKAALNASVRDAQIRDSFNKESCASSTNEAAVEFCNLLYKLQTQLPRNASKLHSLVVAGDNVVYLLNFEVLRSVNIDADKDLLGLVNQEFTKRALGRTKVKSEEEKKGEVDNNDN